MGATMPTAEPHFVVIAMGSAGDMYPFMSLAQAWRRLGRQVTFMGPAFHAEMVRQAGLPFVAIGTREDYLDAIGDPDIWHHRKGFAALFKNHRAHLAQMGSAFEAFAPAQRLVVVAHPLALPGAALARAARPDLQVVGAYLAPSNLRSVHDPLTIGPLHIARWVPLRWREALWRLVETHLIDPIVAPEVNAARQAVGLPPIGHYLAHMAGVADLSVALFPAWFAAPPPDWPRPLLMGEFQLFDPSAGQALAPDLARFLAAGAPPIVFTPGSAHHHAKAFFASALRAAERLGRRAIFLTGHRAQVPPDLPASVHWQPYVALAALLPQVAALVHHGGIGTTAEALRAGVPQLVVPFAWDQFDNAARVVQLGVGRSLPASRAGARRLAQQLEALLASGAMHAQARQVAARFASRYGAERLCRDIDAALGLARGEGPALQSNAA